MLPFKRILCPTDFSEPSYEALKVAQELALHFSAALDVIHVVSLVPVSPGLAGPVAFDVTAYQEELKLSSEKALNDLIKERLSPELKVRPILQQGNAANQIVRTADEQQADLIVIATHGKTGWRRFISGSVTEKTVRLANCPVLTIQAPHQEQAETAD